MSERTRAEHLQWCKDRALEYLPNDTAGAVNSMISDMLKHEDTKVVGEALGPLGMMLAGTGSVSEVRGFILGFN